LTTLSPPPGSYPVDHPTIPGKKLDLYTWGEALPSYYLQERTGEIWECTNAYGKKPGRTWPDKYAFQKEKIPNFVERHVWWPDGPPP
jgi:hypothetical protein